MAFVDEIKIYAKAGDGGDGVVRWLHDKNKELGGPAGGNGGNGGNVYAKAVRNVHILSQYAAKKDFLAENGEPGRGRDEYGANGKDLDILLPIGSVITNLRTDQKFYLDKEDERVLLLTGGRGGRGNKSYKTSVNRSPKEWTPGEPGEEAELDIEVELIADIGLIGLPNAGKTSLLNALTHAKGKIGAYPFTTLEPNLGECYGYIIADIPGLIEGAAEGKGLGHKFLRHVRRTKILVHLISLENEDLAAAYRTIRDELERYDAELFKDKKEIVVLTKTDLIDDEAKLKKIMAAIKKNLPEMPGGRMSKKIFAITILDDENIKNFKDELLKEVKKTD